MLSTMPKPPKKPDPADQPPEEEKSASKRPGKSMQLWVSESLRAALETLRKRNRRTLKAEIEIALENHLRENGLWPTEAD